MLVFQDSMLIYGGMTENDADDSLWSFNVTSIRWSKVCRNVKCALWCSLEPRLKQTAFLYSLIVEWDFCGRVSDVLRKGVPQYYRFQRYWTFHLSPRSCTFLTKGICYLRFKWNSSTLKIVPQARGCIWDKGTRGYVERPFLFLSCIAIGLMLDCVWYLHPISKPRVNKFPLNSLLLQAALTWVLPSPSGQGVSILLTRAYQLCPERWRMVLHPKRLFLQRLVTVFDILLWYQPTSYL